MDNHKKQLRFFKILVAILMMVIIAQGSFWLNSFSSESSNDINPIQKIRSIDQQRKVVAPVVSAVFDFLTAFVPNK